jgi:peptide/nickel transport system substrate-binding protein
MTGRGTLKSVAAGLLVATMLGSGGALAQTLTIGLQDDPDKLDPDLARTFVGRIVFASLCDKLVDINPELDFVPMLATAWQWSEDNKALSFDLREGVVFHDGTPFDAEAVKFNIERSLNLTGSNRASEIRPVQRVEIESPTRVTLHLDGPFSPLLAQLSDRAGMMISPKAAQEAEASGNEFALNPVCAGPYTFTERVAQDRIVVDRFADYWNPETVSLDRIVFRTVPDSTVRLANLQSGDLDIAERIAPTDLETVRGDPNLDVIAVTSLHYHGIRINHGNGPRAENPLGQDPRVRAAFDWSIDREALNQVAFDGAFVPGNQPVAPNNPYYATDLPVPPRDVEKAKALLQEAGLERVSFEMLVGNNPEQMRAAEVIQAMASEAGIEVRIQAMEFAAALDAMARGDFEAMLVGWSGRVDPDGNIHTFIDTNGGLNDGKYSNAKVDELINKARQVGDVDERKRLYAEAAKIYLEDRQAIYLYHNTWLYGVSNKVEGFTPYPDGLIRPFGISKQG